MNLEHIHNILRIHTCRYLFIGHVPIYVGIYMIMILYISILIYELFMVHVGPGGFSGSMYHLI